MLIGRLYFHMMLFKQNTAFCALLNNIFIVELKLPLLLIIKQGYDCSFPISNISLFI